MPIRKIIPKEAGEQRALVDWMTVKGYLFWHTPNGGTRNIAEAMNLKKLGTKSGVPDIFIPMPCNGKYGLFIELKRLSGSIYPANQKFWIEMLNKQGYVAKFAKGFEAAKEIIEEYFRIP